METSLTKAEKSILRQLHLQGFIHWGSMPKSKRVPFLKSLEKKGFLKGLELTNKGIELSR